MEVKTTAVDRESRQEETTIVNSSVNWLGIDTVNAVIVIYQLTRIPKEFGLSGDN